MSRLAGKRAWITGGGSGIGAASAHALAASGAEIFVSGRRKEPLEEVCAAVRANGGTAHALPLDTTDKEAVHDAAQEIGQVDILVASAGLNIPNRGMTDITPEAWDHVVNVNINGVFYPCHAVLPGMRARGDGQLIIISSWAGRYSSRMTGAAYSATKRALISLNESFNDEEGANGIRSTVIMPGEVATPIMKARPKPPSEADMARMLQPEDLGDTVRFVAEMPPRACVNEVLISPTWNRFYQGVSELA